MGRVHDAVKVWESSWIISRDFSSSALIAWMTFPAHVLGAFVIGAKHVLLSENEIGTVQLSPYRPMADLVKAMTAMVLFLLPAI